ncbi:MAG: hypothetical protein ABEH89_00835 [bacterium]
MPWWQKPFTLIVVPHDGSRSSSVTINGLGVALLTALLGCFVGGSVFFLTGFFSSEKPSSTQHLKQKITKLREQNRQYRDLHETVNTLRDKLKNARNLQQSILKLSGLTQKELEASGLDLGSFSLEETTSTSKTLKQTQKTLQNPTRN